MFCSECGAKNKEGDAFCSECGAKLNIDDKSSNNKPSKVKKPMSKKNKLCLIILVAVLVVIGILYKVGSDLTNPKTIAKNYIQAVIDNDADALYKYLDIDGDTTFVNKKIFKEIMKENETETDVINYKIVDVDYEKGGLSATVEFKYTVKNQSTERSDRINLVKEKGKKYLIFDNWKVSLDINDSAIVKDYELEVIKGSTVEFYGIKLTDKYLDKKKSDDDSDVYVLPQVFNIGTNIKVSLPNGMSFEDTVTPSSYNSSYRFDIDEDNLSEAEKTKIEDAAKKSLTTLYSNAISKKSFSEIKSNFESNGIDLSKLENDYNEFVSDLSDASSKLTSIEFTKFSIYDVQINDNNYIEVEFDIRYNYSVQYESWDDELKTNNSSSYSYIILLVFRRPQRYLLAAVSLLL